MSKIVYRSPGHLPRGNTIVFLMSSYSTSCSFRDPRVLHSQCHKRASPPDPRACIGLPRIEIDRCIGLTDPGTAAGMASEPAPASGYEEDRTEGTPSDALSDEEEEDQLSDASGVDSGAEGSEKRKRKAGNVSLCI